MIPEGELESQHQVYPSLRYFKRLTEPIPPEKIRRALAGYYGMIAELDSYVGEVYQALAASGQLDNTLLVFTSDNGMLTGEHGLFYHNCMYDQAIRIPMFMAGPGFPKGRTVNTAVHHVDMVATILRRAGALALGLAETLGGLVLGFAVNPDATMTIDITPGYCDMRSMAFRYAGAERMPLLAARASRSARPLWRAS